MPLIKSLPIPFDKQKDIVIPSYAGHPELLMRSGAANPVQNRPIFAMFRGTITNSLRK